MAVPLVDTRRDAEAHREEYLAAAARVIDSGVFSLGPEVEAFERAFAAYLDVKHVVGVNGGTEALYGAFLALGIGPGDEVVLPANSFIATAEAVMMAGATPLFCDIDPATHHLDLGACRRLVTARTKAIVPVHLYGLACDMRAVTAFAAEHGLRVVEDACQAHGARWNGRRVGSFGAAGCFSFYPTKNLGAIGEGGAICTDDDELAERLRAVRLHGIRREKYRHDIFGTNLKMEALQGAFLQLRLARLDAANARRQEIAARYRAGFAGLPVSFPGDFGVRHVYHWFVLDVDDRDALMAHLGRQNVGCAVHYPIPIHLQPAMARWGGKVGDYPGAEGAASRVMSLPIFPELSDDEVDEVICAVRDFFAERKRIRASVPILTLNCRPMLECMLPELVKNFDDVYIMDGNSTDGTPEFARSMGVRVEKQFDHDLPDTRIEDFIDMRFRLWAKAMHDWLFILDVDEFPTKELVELVRRIVAADRHGEAHRVVRIARLPDGRHVTHAFAYPDRYIRLFRRSDRLTLARRKIHERFILHEDVVQIDHSAALVSRWPEPEDLVRKNEGYLRKEIDSTVIGTPWMYFRWILVYNAYHAMGRLLLTVFARVQSLFVGGVTFPWAYEKIFFAYGWKMVVGCWGRWRRPVS